jgi:hypothetical protein
MTMVEKDENGMVTESEGNTAAAHDACTEVDIEVKDGKVKVSKNKGDRTDREEE